MDAYHRNLEIMMQVWNTPDAAERAQLMDEALEHNVHFVDQNHNIIGREAFLEMVSQTLKRIPGATYAHNSEIQMQNNFCRYHWKIDRDGQNGFDVTEGNDAGRIVKVIGFFGPLKPDS